MKHTTGVRSFALVGVMTAILCIICPIMIHIPVSPVPISLGTLGVVLAVTVLGTKKGTLSVLLYILLGLVGLPVYAGFLSGPGTLWGSTGGYIVGYLLFAIIYGIFLEKGNSKLVPAFIGLLLGTVAVYTTGCLWLSFHHALTFWETISIGVLPYLVGDVVKMVLALTLGLQLRGRLEKVLS